MSDIAHKVRILREARDLSQSALAKEAGISVTMISLVESGQKRPSPEVAARIAKVLQVPIELLARSPEGQPIADPTGNAAALSLRRTLAKMVRLESQLRAALGESSDESKSRINPDHRRVGEGS